MSNKLEMPPVFVDAKIVNPFLNCTMNVFRDMLYFLPDYGKPYIGNPISNHRWEVTGIAELEGESSGIVALRLTNFLAEKLLAQTGLTIEVEEERPEILDGLICELVNMISSQASTELGQYSISITPPYTVLGENHLIAWPQRIPIIGVPFNTKYGPFVVELCLLSKK
ncbi:MAG: chemotaxis protein CheX [Spirochaetales bacterium]|nr:chemotaxis protein CheX [Spirochaetales bacterium]